MTEAGFNLQHAGKWRINRHPAIHNASVTSVLIAWLNQNYGFRMKLALLHLVLLVFQPCEDKRSRQGHCLCQIDQPVGSKTHTHTHTDATVEPHPLITGSLLSHLQFYEESMNLRTFIEWIKAWKVRSGMARLLARAHTSTHTYTSARCAQSLVGCWSTLMVYA